MATATNLEVRRDNLRTHRLTTSPLAALTPGDCAVASGHAQVSKDTVSRITDSVAVWIGFSHPSVTDRT